MSDTEQAAYGDDRSMIREEKRREGVEDGRPRVGILGWKGVSTPWAYVRPRDACFLRGKREE